MSLAKVATSADPDHVTACPFVLPGTPVPPPVARHKGEDGAAQPEMTRTE